jgi:hypothetical protein
MAAVRRWNLKVSAAPVAPSGPVIVSDTPPVPEPGKIWWDSVTCRLFFAFDDGSSTQWIQASE